MKVSAVFACIKVISQTIACLPFKLFRRDGDSKSPATDRSLYYLVHDSPNDYLTAFDWVEMMLVHLNFRGNSYDYISGNGRIRQLLPLNPARMKVERLPDGQISYDYAHEDGKHEIFPQDKIWHKKYMPISCNFNSSAPEGILGVSPITAAGESIGISLAADEYGGKFFSNYAQTGLAVKHPGKLSENARAFLKESFEQYSDAQNKFKTLILQEGLEVEKLGITNTDSQFLESRQFQIEEIARIFGVPPILIGHPTNTMTYASAEQLFLSFAKFTILPWCRRIEQSANKYLLSESERKQYFFEFVIDGLLRAEIKTRAEYYSKARQWGWLNVDEIRKMENLDALPDDQGKVFLEPINMRPAGEYNPADPQNNNNLGDENATT